MSLSNPKTRLLVALEAVAAAHEREAATIREFCALYADATKDGGDPPVGDRVADLLLSSLNNSNRVGYIRTAIGLAAQTGAP